MWERPSSQVVEQTGRTQVRETAGPSVAMRAAAAGAKTVGWVWDAGATKVEIV